ncbi:helix-turn-helix domain-containing protein [Vibrio rotiferianus]|uniref:helix-turn-helix domain-containing protein n=1 Tax=Vibrio rotiferianus TaxID=190895 RepID=UPI00397FDE34
MREWFTSNELLGLDGSPSSLTAIAQKARRNNWLKRKASGQGRAFEYHISNFHYDVKKQLIEKYVTNADEAELLLRLTGPMNPFDGGTEKSYSPYTQTIADALNEKIKVWFDFQQLSKIEGFPHHVEDFLAKAKNEKWLPRLGSEFREFTQYHITSFPNDIKALILSKYVSDGDEVKTILSMTRSEAAQQVWFEAFQPPGISPMDVPDLVSKLDDFVQQVVNRKPDSPSRITKPQPSATTKKDNVIIYYDISASAGAGTLVEYEPSRKVELNDTLQLALNIQNPSKARLLNMEGDSMLPTLKDKSILAIEELGNFKQDGVYVFTFDSTLYVKRLQKNRDGIKVISDNPIYDAWFINRDEVDTPIFTIHGRVTGCAQSV